MENDIYKDYWEARGRLSFEYKGEIFYTVTPIPCYYHRRQILLKLMLQFIKNDEVERVCDFGCGDGWYLKYLSDRCLGKEWFGVDLSESMIARAREECPTANLQISSDGITFQDDFDLIYSVAVFAHVMNDDVMKSLFQNISHKLRPGGYFLVFEQTGPKRQAGDVWCRRTSEEYVDLAAKYGMIAERRFLITFSAHRFFERTLGRYYRNLFSQGCTYHERCISANKSPFFRALSSLMLAFSFRPLRPDDGRTYGNTFLVFKKLPTAGGDCRE